LGAVIDGEGKVDVYHLAIGGLGGNQPQPQADVLYGPILLWIIRPPGHAHVSKNGRAKLQQVVGIPVKVKTLFKGQQGIFGCKPFSPPRVFCRSGKSV